MLDALPFQPQEIPTLTMYERQDAGFSVYESEIVANLPGLTSLAPGSPLDGSTSETETLNARPALTAVFFSPAVEVDSSDGPIKAAPGLSAFVYYAPISANEAETVLDSAPALATLLQGLPVDSSQTEPDALNSAPGLSAMTKT